MLTQERLKEVLHYDPDTGAFTWLKDMRANKVRNDSATCLNLDGYLVIQVDAVQYRQHRLAFLYMDGDFPSNQVDHINRKRADNRWCNLRRATSSENMSNKKNNNQTIGVYWCKRENRWIARTNVSKGKRKFLGQFKYYLQACAARWQYESLLPERAGV